MSIHSVIDRLTDSEEHATDAAIPPIAYDAVEVINELREENDKLRYLLAKSKADCVYCGLPASDMNRCSHGFPGCSRGDDLTNFREENSGS